MVQSAFDRCFKCRGIQAFSLILSGLMSSAILMADVPAPVGFIEIAGGDFTMGATSGDGDLDAPSITVTVSSFYIAETETTKSDWDAVRVWALGNGYAGLAAGGGKAGDHPVQTVNWWEVLKWCNARSEMEGLTPVYMVGAAVMRSGTTVPQVNWTANGYRLPTEAEWEKAARGGVSGKRFPWGTDAISHAEANYYGSTGISYDLSPINDHHPGYTTGGAPYTSPVGSFSGNGYGLMDTAGNVFEWCWDWFDSGYYTISSGTIDPRGPSNGSIRVLRGGGWNGPASRARNSYRDGGSPLSANDQIGFRLARSNQLAATRPDIAVGSTAGGLTGIRSYSPALQAAILVSKKAKPVMGFATLANRGTLPDALSAQGTGGNALFPVTYLGPEGNITAALLAGTYQTGEMENGDPPVWLRASIAPNKKKLTKKSGNRITILKRSLLLTIQVRSVLDPGFSDSAGIRVQTK